LSQLVLVLPERWLVWLVPQGLKSQQVWPPKQLLGLV
jgi:hypothetical protein